MKKLWQATLIATLAGLAVSSYADVQNIRLTGDIRIRGYYMNNDTTGIGGSEISDSFISQRTRVSVEADLEDHVLVVVTLKAEGLWGSSDEPNRSAGAGTTPALDLDEESGEESGYAINRRFDVGVTEAYVQFSEMFYSPVTLKLGRQYLHYGRGLIISAVEDEYNFDAARMVLDYYPLTIDLVYAKLKENSSFGEGSSERDIDLAFVNARYELADSLIKSIEGYLAYVVNNSSSAGTAGNAVPPAVLADSPITIGIRSDMNLTDGLETWIEGAYQFGSAAAGSDISAWLGNIGGRYTLKDVSMAPVLNFTYTYASGGGGTGQKSFRPMFDYVEGYNGYLLSPALSNIHIFNLGASVKPADNTTVSLQGYYYLAADKGSFVNRNGNIDNTTALAAPGATATSREIGWEIDTIINYDYSKDVSLQLIYAAFIPDNLIQAAGVSSVAHEVRAEVNVRF